jgi:small GTP-binding protein
MKVVVLGAYNVGKTTLIGRMCHVSESIKHTVGIELKTTSRHVENLGSVHIKFFDTSGYDHYETLLQPYIYNADVILLVYSVTDMNSYKVVLKWLNKIAQNDTTFSNVVIVGNKNDLVSERRVHRKDALKCVKQYKNLDMFVMEASAHTNSGVEETFQVLVREGSREIDTIDLLYTGETFKQKQTNNCFIV